MILSCRFPNLPDTLDQSACSRNKNGNVKGHYDHVPINSFMYSKHGFPNITDFVCKLRNVISAYNIKYRASVLMIGLIIVYDGTYNGTWYSV